MRAAGAVGRVCGYGSLLACAALCAAAPASGRAGSSGLTARLHVAAPALKGDHAQVAGQVDATSGTVVVEQRSSGTRWHAVARGRVAARGHFHVSFVLDRVGAESYRAVFRGVASQTFRVVVRGNGASLRVKSRTVVLRSGVVAVSGAPTRGQTIQLAAGRPVPGVGSVVIVPDPRHSAAGRVVKAVRSRTGAVLTTTPASLSDAYSSARIAVNDSLANLHPLLATRQTARAANLSDLPFTCSGSGGPRLHEFDFHDTKVSLFLSIYGPSITFLLTSNPRVSVGLFMNAGVSCKLSGGAWLTFPVPDVPGLFAKLGPVVRASASGSLDVDYTWEPHIVYGFGRGQNLSPYEVHGFGQSSQVTARIAAKAQLFAGMSASIEYGGVAGVTGEIGGALTAATTAQNGQTCLTVDGALHAALSAQAQVFKRGWSFTLAQGDFGHVHIGTFCPPNRGGSGGGASGGGGTRGGVSPPLSGGSGAGSSSSVTVSQGPAAKYGYFYEITLRNFAPNSYVTVVCFDTQDPGGFAPTQLHTDGTGTAFTDRWCYSAQGPEYWVTAAGMTSNRVRWGAAPGTSPPPTDGGFNETTGPSGSGTFADYVHAGNPQGDRIGGYVTVKVSCRITGFRVADGTNWWYRVASSPWNDQFYASSDNFYNNGQTSGNINNGVIVDAAVPLCSGSPPPPPPRSGGGAPPPGSPPTSPPVAAPTGVSVAAPTPGDMLLTWTAVAGAAYYELSLDGTTLFTTTETTFDWPGFHCGEIHTLGVQAVSDGRTSAMSSISATTTSCSMGGGRGSGPTNPVQPTISSIPNVTVASGDPGSYPVRVNYVDDDCDVVGGTWVDAQGVTHAFGNADTTDPLHPSACVAGIGYLTPGYSSCTSPEGVRGTPGEYAQTITIRDSLGRVSAPYTFYVICQ